MENPNDNLKHNDVFSENRATIFHANPHLKTLLLVLIFVFLASGVALSILSFKQNERRQRLYEETEAQLPKNGNRTLDKEIGSELDPDGWKTYRLDKYIGDYGFEVKFPPSVSAGNTADNSVLGTVDEPVKGFHIGHLVFIPLTNKNLLDKAEDYFYNYYNDAPHPPLEENEGGIPPIECEQNYETKESLVIKYVSCTGEGGPALYGLIQGGPIDFFIDGYSGGYGSSTEGGNTELSGENFVKMIMSFEFIRQSLNN